MVSDRRIVLVLHVHWGRPGSRPRRPWLLPRAPELRPPRLLAGHPGLPAPRQLLGAPQRREGRERGVGLRLVTESARACSFTVQEDDAD